MKAAVTQRISISLPELTDFTAFEYLSFQYSQEAYLNRDNRDNIAFVFVLFSSSSKIFSSILIRKQMNLQELEEYMYVPAGSLKFG